MKEGRKGKKNNTFLNMEMYIIKSKGSEISFRGNAL